MKASLSISAALVPLYAALVVPTAATATICNETDFEANPSTVLTEPISSIYVGLANTCAGEGLFQMPRMTWTIEPNPDDSVNTTSVFLSPSNIGTVVVEYDDLMMGIDVDPAAVMNAAAIGVRVQTPKDGLNLVSVKNGPVFINIVKGFTNLRTLYLGGEDTCAPVRDGYIEYDCPFCDLYTHDEVKGIGSSIVADLSEVNVDVEDALGTSTMYVRSWGVNNLTLALPENGENGVPVEFRFESASSKIEIKGNIDCDMSTGGQCRFQSNRASGCKDCSNELIIDGSINGYFNVSTESPLFVNMSDGGCDHLALDTSIPFFRSPNMDQMKCSEGNVTVNVEFLPCIGADIGTLECGLTPFPADENETACYCVAPLPDRECPPEESSGVSLGSVWIVSLLLPIAALLG